MCEQYNGWKNRETWALNLWLTNDQGLYELTRERVAEVIGDYTDLETEDKWAARAEAGEVVQNLWSELTDSDNELLPDDEIISMLRDVGSVYRVDWGEIGTYWLSDLDESDDES